MGVHGSQDSVPGPSVEWWRRQVLPQVPAELLSDLLTGPTHVLHHPCHSTRAGRADLRELALEDQGDDRLSPAGLMLRPLQSPPRRQHCGMMRLASQPASISRR
jgi:hypothetical protein